MPHHPCMTTDMLQVFLVRIYLALVLFDHTFSEGFDDSEDATTLKVHFKDLTCIKYRRDMYMTWDGLFGMQLRYWFCLFFYNLIKLYHLRFVIVERSASFRAASFGGIFGLCLGGSVISLVELFYYFTVKLYNKITNRRYDENRKRMEKTVAAHKNHHQQQPQSKQQQQYHHPPVQVISVDPVNYYPTKPSIDLGTSDNKLQLKLNSNRMPNLNKSPMGKATFHEYKRPNMKMFMR